jgi:hypothetical protein
MIYWNKATTDERRLLKAISLVLGKHPKLLIFMFEAERPRLRRSPEVLVEESRAFSRNEGLLVRVGLDLWSGSGNALVWEVIECLDYDEHYYLLEGLKFCGTKFKGCDEANYRQLKLPGDNFRRQLNLDIGNDI